MDGEVVWSRRLDADVNLVTMLRIAPGMVTRKPDHQGERGVSRNTIAQGMPVFSGEPVVTNSCAFYFAREAAGASDTRLSLRPLF